MSAVDARCPACGTINKSVDLEETDGWNAKVAEK